MTGNTNSTNILTTG